MTDASATLEPIPAVVAFIEGIVYLSMSDIEFSRKYS